MLSVQRMFEVQHMGMKCLPRKGFQRLASRRRQLIRFGLESRAVDLIAEKRMADGGKVNSSSPRPGLGFFADPIPPGHGTRADS